MVEGATLASAEGPPLRGLGRDRGRRRTRHGLLERAPASVRLGPSAASSTAPSPRDRGRPKSYTDLADAPLSSLEERRRRMRLPLPIEPVDRAMDGAVE